MPASLGVYPVQRIGVGGQKSALREGLDGLGQRVMDGEDIVELR